jgi:hypothetical protein
MLACAFRCNEHGSAFPEMVRNSDSSRFDRTGRYVQCGGRTLIEAITDLTSKSKIAILRASG